MSSPLATRRSALRAYPVKAALLIPACALVLLDATGHAVLFDGAAGTEKLAGLSRNIADNSAGVDGAIKVDVEHQEILLINSGDVKQTHIGTKVYVSAKNTVSIDSDTNKHPIAGVVTEVSTDGVWVKPEIV